MSCPARIFNAAVMFKYFRSFSLKPVIAIALLAMTFSASTNNLSDKELAAIVAVILGGTDLDTDSDGDGVPDIDDVFPDDPNETVDSDKDGVGDNADECDTTPTSEAGSVDAAGCGPSQRDSDGDGVLDADDAFPYDGKETQDSDGDGVGDNSDAFPDDGSKSKAIVINFSSGGVSSIALNTDAVSLSTNAQRTSRDGRTTSSENNNIIAYDENGAEIGDAVETSDILFVAEAVLTPDGEYLYLLTSPHMQRALTLPPEECSLYRVQLSTEQVDCLINEAGDVRPKVLNEYAVFSSSRKGIDFRADGAAVLFGLNYNRNLPEGIVGGTQNGYAWLLTSNSDLIGIEPSEGFFVWDALWLDDARIALYEHQYFELGGDIRQIRVVEAATLTDIENSPVIIDYSTSFARGPLGLMLGGGIMYKNNLEVVAREFEKRVVEDENGNFFGIVGDNMLRLIAKNGAGYALNTEHGDYLLELQGAEPGARAPSWQKQSGTGTDVKYTQVSSSDTYLIYTKGFNARTPIISIEGQSWVNGRLILEYLEGSAVVSFGDSNKAAYWGVSVSDLISEDVVINYTVQLPNGSTENRSRTIPADAINAWYASGDTGCEAYLDRCLNWANPEPDEEGFCIHKYGTAPEQDKCVQFNQPDNPRLAYEVLVYDMETFRGPRYDSEAVYPEGNGNAFPGVQTVALIDGRLQAYFKDSRDHQYYIAVADADNFWENGDSALLFASAKNGSGDNAIITGATSLTLPAPLPLADVTVAAELSGEQVTVSITLPSITDTQGYEFNRFAPMPAVTVKALSSVSPLTPLAEPVISADNTLSITFAADDFTEGQIYLAELPNHFLVNGSVRRRTPATDLLFNAPEAADVIRGRTIDGYIRGATVFLDVNGNGNLDDEEPSGQSGDGGRFEIALNASQAACKNLAPVVADVPVGAVDESEGSVEEAYQMVLPPGTEALAAGQEVNITPLTSILWAELYDLYNSGQLPGLSCEELQNNPEAQAALQEKIEEAIANAVRAYNVSEEDLLGDFIASNSSQSQLTARDIVEGLKWSLREKIRLEQLYPDAQHITVAFMRVPGTKFGDPNADPSDAYGWYVDYSIFEEKLIRRGIVRLDDTLTSELYTVFYRERYPSTLNMAGVEYRYARSLRLTDNPDSPYECWGQEFAVARIEYGGHSEATPMGLGNMEYQIENETTMPVDSYEQCGPEVHQQPLLLQAVQPTEWSRYRNDSTFKESTQYRFQGDNIPLPHIRGFANDPDILTRETLIAAFHDLEWRFFEPESATTSMEDKDLETDGQQLFMRKSKYPDDAPPRPPLGSWQRIERFENGTQLEQWANAPFSTPAGCIDWESGPTQPPGNDVDPICDTLAYYEVTIETTGEGRVSPAGPLSLPAGERLRATLLPAPGYALESVESNCGGSPHGITYLSDELTDNCSVSVSFVATEIDEIFDCPAEAWTEVGTEIPGEQASTLDADGAWSTGMNANGTVIAEGARYSDQGGIYSGHVRVFALVEGAWVQRGLTLTGATGETMGWDVALDAAGDTLVVGAPCERAGCTGGYARIYDFDGDSWVQRGEDIVGLADEDREGWAVAISDDGQRVLTLSQYGTTDELKRASRVRVFDWQESSWQQAGNSLYGPTDYTYPRVARLSQTGDYLVIGYPSADLQYPDSSQVSVRKLINHSWQQVGQTLVGPMEGPFDKNLGIGVAISAGDDYLTLALGSDNGLGIFDLVDARWVQRGSIITGPYSSSSQLGWGIEIRESGNLVAASSVDGLVGIWGWKIDHWVQIGGWLGAGAAGTRDIGLSINGRNLVIAQQEFDLRRGRLKTYTQSGCLYASRNARRLKVHDSNSVSGNLITDDDGYGVDSSPEINELNVTEVDRTNGDNYGALTFNADGSYTYTLDINNAEVQFLSATDLLNEAYTYTLSDGVGGQKTGTLNVTIEGSDRRVEVLFDDEVGSTWYAVRLNENGGYCSFSGGYCSNWSGPINLSYEIVDDAERGGVIQIEHINDTYGEFAIGSLGGRDWSDFAGGEIRFDIRVIGDTADNISDWFLMIYCGCGSPVTLSNISPQGWQTISIRVDDLVADGASLNNMQAPFAIWPDATQQNGVTYQLDNIRWIGP